MSRYDFAESIRDGATRELHFEPRLVDLHIDQAEIDRAFKELTGRLSDLERDQLGKMAAKMAVLLKTPDRIAAVCADIAQHFQEKVVPNGFGAQVVTFDRESCLLYKRELDQHLPPEVYESVKPSTGTGRLLWHKLGAKTIELIHENVHVDAVQDDLETLVLDADLLEAVLGAPDPGKESKKVEIKVARLLRRHMHDPRFKALTERLEDLKNRHEQGLLTSVEFLKELLHLAKDVVATEQAAPPIEDEDRGKAALTELFREASNADTPVMVERVVNDIDEIVRIVRFDGWQNTHAGEREVKMALRKTLFKYRLHQDQELFGKAYKYIAMYY